MPNFELLVAFLLATAVFAYMPGPSTLYAAAQTIAKGQRGGLMAALGIHIGGYVHVVAAALGLAALFTAVPTLYAILKFAGAAYLVWLGIRFITSKVSLDTKSARVDGKLPVRAFWQSVTVEVLNPKTAIFYVAFLPQFTELSASLAIWSQLLILGTVVNVMFSSADLLCVFLADRITLAFQKSHFASRVANKIGGGLLIGLGVNLAATRQ